MQYLLLACLLTLSVYADEVCYPPCGCFHDDPPFHDRPLPDDPVTQELRFDLYTRENPETAIQIWWPWEEDDEMPDEYDPTKISKFLIGGWNPSGFPPGVTEDELYTLYGDFPGDSQDSDYSLSDIRRAFLRKYDYNVFQVRWPEGAGYYFYPQSASNAQVAGACTAYFALQITEADLVHCIGHSLGGQTCGYMGHYTDGTMGRLTGLDPAGPWFDKEESEIRIDKEDALFVDNIYGNVNDTLLTLGLGRPVGHADFYPNGGGRQPGCLTAGCDHDMPKDYYHSSIDTDCLFLSYPCDSHEDISDGLCNECEEGATCQHQGYYSNTMPGNGTFYLATLPMYPHCNP